MTFDEFDKEIQGLIPKRKKELKVAAVKIGNAAANVFAENFDNQGFGTEHWKEVKRRIPGTPEYKYPKAKQLSRRLSNILVRTGKLKKAVQGSFKGISERSNSVEVNMEVNNDYAEFHQDGTEHIPQRKFIGETAKLDDKVISIIEDTLTI